MSPSSLGPSAGRTLSESISPLEFPSENNGLQSSGDDPPAVSDSPAAQLGSDQATELRDNNSAVAAMPDSDDRSAFDRRLTEIMNSLQILEKSQESDRSEPSHEFELELHSLERLLDHIDPTLNP